MFRRIVMNKYLKEVKGLVGEGEGGRKLLVVLGNESVDLDSAVSSICLAYHLHNTKCDSHIIPDRLKSQQFLVVPAINATREELPLKTEVTHWLLKHQVELENLLCRDEISLKGNVENFVLVDHHVSEYRDKVISVLDHRPFEANSNLSSECFKNIQEVGSCATLVCDTIRKDVISGEDLKEKYSEALKICYGAIVLDGINFSEAAGKVRLLDFEVVEFIEKLLEIKDVQVDRKNLFDELVAARADVSSLDSLQLLSKDLKIISSDDGRVRVAIPGVDVFQYITLENAADNVKLFAQRNDINVVALMGMRPSGDSVKRFMGIINIDNSELFDGIIEAVTAMKNPDLLLESKEGAFMSGNFYQQRNVQASRKQILPVIKSILNRY